MPKEISQEREKKPIYELIKRENKSKIIEKNRSNESLPKLDSARVILKLGVNKKCLPLHVKLLMEYTLKKHE